MAETPQLKKEALTKQELITIQNLLYAGNFGLSASQFDQSIKPLINKLARLVDSSEENITK